MFHAEYTSMFMICVHGEFHMPCSSSSLLFAMKTNDKCRAYHCFTWSLTKFHQIDQGGPDVEGSRRLWNVGKLPDYKAQKSRRRSPSYLSPWEPQISQIVRITQYFSVLSTWHYFRSYCASSQWHVAIWSWNVQRWGNLYGHDNYAKLHENLSSSSKVVTGTGGCNDNVRLSVFLKQLKVSSWFFHFARQNHVFSNLICKSVF
jgi:hypothetical protein